jgi:bleomycin hydrolase
MSDDGSISIEMIQALRKSFSEDPTGKIVQNALTNGHLIDVALDRSLIQRTDATFSTKLDQWKATNQKSSGRCWLFAALNLFRPGAMEQMNVKEFEFSQAHIHFWDKFERSNCFLESIIELGSRNIEDRTVHFLLNDPIGDGGQWNMAMNLIRKHGLVPKSVFPESQSSSATRWMNASLKDLLRSSACELRKMISDGMELEKIRARKEEMVGNVWRLLCMHLGTPPERFDWQWRDKDNKFHRKGEMTPLEFSSEFVSVDWDDYVCLVHDPRNEMYRTYTVDRLQNVAGGPPVVYLNIPIMEIKRITMEIIEGGLPVWMGCDVGKQMHRKKGLWDSKLYDLQGLYGFDYGMSKRDRLIHGQTVMTHAMLFTGVDVVDGTPRRWRVENSWGTKDSGENGFFTMNDNWFDEYMFEIASPVSRLDSDMKEGLKTTPLVLPAWDPMGSLARRRGMIF